MLDRDSFSSWIGLKLTDGFTVVDVVGIGAHRVVFKISLGSQSRVLKVLKTHIGFCIGLPPNRLFPEQQHDYAYSQRLADALSQLQCSPGMAMLSPVYELCSVLAVGHIERRVDGGPRTERFRQIGRSSFVKQILADWSEVDVSQDQEEPGGGMITIYEADRPIHTTFRQVLAEQAKKALDGGIAWDNAREDVAANPLIPWICAATTGYCLPGEAAIPAAQALSRQAEPLLAVQQAGEFASYACREISWDTQLDVNDFVMEVFRASSLALENLRIAFLSGVNEEE